jgi:hypothetical protein
MTFHQGALIKHKNTSYHCIEVFKGVILAFTGFTIEAIKLELGESNYFSRRLVGSCVVISTAPFSP